MSFGPASALRKIFRPVRAFVRFPSESTLIKLRKICALVTRISSGDPNSGPEEDCGDVGGGGGGAGAASELSARDLRPLAAAPACEKDGSEKLAQLGHNDEDDEESEEDSILVVVYAPEWVGRCSASLRLACARSDRN